MDVFYLQLNFKNIMKVKKIKDNKIVNYKNNFCSLLLFFVTACKKCVPVKRVVTVVPAAISF